MPQSLSQIYIHVVFATKGRAKLLQNEDIRQGVHAYIAGICGKLGCYGRKVGGTEDHVHILVNLNRNKALADVIREIKKSSTKKVKKDGLEGFGWQAGYSAFSVSESNLNRVVKYIGSQKEHHKKMTLEEEIRLLLEKHNVNYEPDYLFD